jgi:adenine-specific DNA-methyltransferase
MKVENSQSFLSLYFEPGVVEVATGDLRAEAANKTWQRDSKSLGQVETPRQVADLMARWVMSTKPATVLDPAAGIGTLLDACNRVNDRAQLVGVECDAQTMQLAKARAPRGTKLILADYLLSDAGLFDGIIANPPYIKAQRLSYAESDWRYFEERLGTPLDRLTNAYALFLLKIWEDLAVGGRAAVLIPAEFLNANFGEEIKARLLRELRPAGIVVFAPELNVFANALTTSAIVFLHKDSCPLAGPLRATKATSLDVAAGFVEHLLGQQVPNAEARYTDLAALNPRDKWLNLLLNEPRQTDSKNLTRRIGDYFDCRRGIATGANEFFCLSASGLHQHGLNLEDVEPCVTKAVDASGLVFSREKFASLVAADRRCFLLNPRHKSRTLDLYLQNGEQLGIPKRHLPCHRPVWYRPENRAVADIWVAVFSRENVKFILNTSGAKNLTCFHGLYAKPGCEHLAPLLAVFLNSSGAREAFAQVNRFYGDGLNKLEPKDVEAMPCPELPHVNEAEAAEIIQRLLQLDSKLAGARTADLDALLSRYLNQSNASTVTWLSEAAAQPASFPDPTQNLPLAGRRKRRVAQVP